MAVQDYQQFAYRYLREAEERIGEGDYLQGSEKLWGAAAEMVKAVAASRGWRHDGHVHLFAAVNRLREETGDPELNRLFLLANSLHTNFYENWLTPEQVLEGLEDVRKFLDKVAPSLLQDS